MALDTTFYPQDHIGICGYDYNFLQDDNTFCEFLENNKLVHNYGQVHANYWDYNSTSSAIPNYNNYYYDMNDHWGATISSPDDYTGGGTQVDQAMIELPVTMVGPTKVAGVGRRKRRRTTSGKNKQDLENQRMTHIAVERNRRKQMNEYLAVIRSLMPSSYVQRSDQASIVGGAINYVKELEQQLQILEVQKRANDQKLHINNIGYSPPILFSDFFNFPQYSLRLAVKVGNVSSVIPDNRLPAMAEIEVTMVENHANLKVLSKKRPRQLLKFVTGLQCLWLTILHLNVTTIEQMAFYGLSVKIEEGCQLSTVDEIADAVNCILARIEEEALNH
ncbi:transcription factor bHLH94-like [Rutidosis leptorrhynchoides]|uniref:transcription factor bHLH94-like n=1 Tax=Rutidosis leptorrhynchoides TaxID=125765 RepID=UPI003A99FAF1